MSNQYDRFSSLYLNRGAEKPDSDRARRRLGAEFRVQCDAWSGVLALVATDLDSESGASLPRPYYTSQVAAYIEECPVHDVLDFITFTFRRLKQRTTHERHHPEKDWLAFAQRVFDEENLSYRVDAAGVVHFKVDQEYDDNIASALNSLEASKFGAARTEFQNVRNDMTKAKPDLIDATRGIFAASESVFKIVTGNDAKLDAGEVRRTLAPYIDRKMKDADSVAKSAAGRMTEGFRSWVDSCHRTAMATLSRTP